MRDGKKSKREEIKGGPTHYVTIPGQVMFNRKLTFLDKFVFWYVRYKNGTDKTGKYFVCYESNEAIAKKVGVSKGHVIRSITRLVKHGYLKRKVQSNYIRELRIDHSLFKKYELLILEWEKSGMLGASKNAMGASKNASNKRNQTTTSLKRKEVVSSQASRILLKKTPCKEKRVKSRKIFVRKESEVDKVIALWNSLGKPFVQHKINTQSKIIRKAKKYITLELGKTSAAKIKQSMRDWHSFLGTPNTMFSRKYNIFQRQALPDFFHPSTELTTVMKRHKPPIKVFTPYAEAWKGWENLEKKFIIKDQYPRVTSAIYKEWSNRHGAGNANDFVKVAEKWVKRVGGQPTTALDNIDYIKYAIDKIPPHYNSSYMMSNHFWGEFLKEKLIEYEGGKL